MKVMIVADGHYFRTPDGRVYVQSVFNYNFYSRYLQGFEKVCVVARIKDINEEPVSMHLASGEGIEFLDLPPYKGPWQYLKRYFDILRISKKYSKECDCAIFRIPGATANIMCRAFLKTKKPFAIEVVVDPWEYFAPGTVSNKLRPLIRLNWTNFLQKVSKKANGVSYVTEKYLQRKYPCTAIFKGESESYFTSHYSSVSLPKGSYGSPKKYNDKNKFTITHTANSFATYGKGHITLMNALKIVRERGYDVNVIFIGDGPLKDEFSRYARSLSIENAVSFIGRLPNGDEVREVIKNSDLFVFPTMAEGLPRALLEAMSVGLPCLSTPVCGIPEILPNEYLIDYNDHEEFANKIIYLISNLDIMEVVSARNLKKAYEFTEEALNTRRKDFYRKLSQLTKKLQRG